MLGSGVVNVRSFFLEVAVSDESVPGRTQGEDDLFSGLEERSGISTRNGGGPGEFVSSIGTDVTSG